MKYKEPLTWRILEALSEAAMTATDLFIGIGKAGGTTSQGRMMKAIIEQRKRRQRYFSEYAEKRAYSSLIYNLKKDGLISSDGSGLALTAKGKARLKSIREKKKFIPAEYEKKESLNFVIFSYDISGKKFKERRWLRNALFSLELKPIQQSVWIGKVKIPEEFLNDLKRLDILKYAQIFEITKKGTLREI